MKPTPTNRRSTARPNAAATLPTLDASSLRAVVGGTEPVTSPGSGAAPASYAATG